MQQRYGLIPSDPSQSCPLKWMQFSIISGAMLARLLHMTGTESGTLPNAKLLHLQCLITRPVSRLPNEDKARPSFPSRLSVKISCSNFVPRNNPGFEGAPASLLPMPSTTDAFPVREREPVCGSKASNLQRLCGNVY